MQEAHGQACVCRALLGLGLGCKGAIHWQGPRPAQQTDAAQKQPLTSPHSRVAHAQRRKRLVGNHGRLRNPCGGVCNLVETPNRQVHRFPQPHTGTYTRWRANRRFAVGNSDSPCPAQIKRAHWSRCRLQADGKQLPRPERDY